jgi:hypothetical protein
MMSTGDIEYGIYINIHFPSGITALWSWRKTLTFSSVRSHAQSGPQCPLGALKLGC